ncbi:acyl carrier protein [Bacillus thuringiensis]|uniref:acyl carrier protein n=1 Tax=Bacillus thuringiensis TaxID=1428 RepID=UPI0011A6A49B|nr:acyl carrier protein [Bacillus thuringiensis]
MREQDIQDQVISIVQDILETKKNFDSSEDLSGSGMDSINSINLIVELEDMFNITFGDEELLFDNFSNIEKIVKQVISKRGEPKT